MNLEEIYELYDEFLKDSIDKLERTLTIENCCRMVNTNKKMKIKNYENFLVISAWVIMFWQYQSV